MGSRNRKGMVLEMSIYPYDAIFTDDGWLTETWLKDGIYDMRHGYPDYNLISEWSDEPQEFAVWVRGCEISMNSPFAGNTEWRKVRVRIVKEQEGE